MLGKLIYIAKDKYVSHKSFFIYLTISVFVTILDIAASRLSEKFAEVLIANTIGVVTGFIVQYFLTSRHVYGSKNTSTFIKFLLTFLIGLSFANLIIYVCRTLIFNNSESFAVFIISKGISIVMPFFIIYFIRKRWIKTDKYMEK